MYTNSNRHRMHETDLKVGDYISYDTGDGSMEMGHVFDLKDGGDTIIIDNGYGGARGLKYVSKKDIKKL